MKMRMEPTNNGTLVGLRDSFQMDPPKWWQQFYRECGENSWAPAGGGFAAPLWQLCRPFVAAVPPPLFTSDKREASLVGGNFGIQKSDSVDPLSLVIKCLGGGGFKSWVLVVLIITSGGQVNTHTHFDWPLGTIPTTVPCHLSILK
jgi:hypothetical protein